MPFARKKDVRQIIYYREYCAEHLKREEEKPEWKTEIAVRINC